LSAEGYILILIWLFTSFPLHPRYQQSWFQPALSTAPSRIINNAAHPYTAVFGNSASQQR